MSNHRASLLAGLRTGGVRSVSNPGQIPNAPMTAAIGGQFPRHSSPFVSGNVVEFQGSDQFYSDSFDTLPPGAPMTASVLDGGNFVNMQQQHAQAVFLQAQMQAQAMQRAFLVGQANANRGVSPDPQTIQLQIDLLKLQALQQQQQQQFQAQMLAQAQLQQQLQQTSLPRRRTTEPTTAGSTPSVFSLPSLARSRNASGTNVDNIAPPTSALDSRFPTSRAASSLNPNAAAFKMGESATASVTSNSWRSVSNTVPTVQSGQCQTTVISGGTSLGASQAKHDAAASWRRSSTTSGPPSPTAPLTRGSSPPSSPPAVYVSTPEETSPTESRSTSQMTLLVKPRPMPLHFNLSTLHDATEDGMAGQVLVTPEEDDSREATPTSGTSSISSAREEASKRLYESLGIGRPAMQTEIIRQISLPARQPRGPPSGVEELGAKNFAARIRRRAIGGLGSLMESRNRRVSMIEVEAF
ncbi:uncharacterized protein EI90DRAFT_3129901 [Cantharellus anzutake]|uniref:uncharacterized protein n=1 Tax=Cantharellus anzutake TaxID=1750568 RepID=UPI00190617A6|nr:uncharacterized protein EI90DRAFT_3129901 [Cantharellus anzutake]KAF8324434.1 hypothetical protein EI90DRAFT_3129901 [Cantharellus anzutake]